MQSKKKVRVWRVAVVMALLMGCSQKVSQPPGAEPRVIQGTTLPGVVSPAPPGPKTAALTAPPTSEQPAVPLRRFTQGEVLYVQNCADCHGWEGRGDGPVGQVLLKQPPSLRQPELLTRNTEAELVARILLGKDLAVPLAATAVKDTDADVSAVLAHVRRLPTMPWKDTAAGREVYDSLCVSCHGIYGRGDGLLAPALAPRPRDLSDPVYQKAVSDADLLRVISEGRGAMPGAAAVLSAEERRAVIVFLRLLSPGYELYDRFCEVCHGATGLPPEVAQQELFSELLGITDSPPSMPVFDKKYFNTHTDEQVRGWVRHMLTQHRAVMPHFGGDLNAEEIRQILAYLRSLAPQS